MGGHRLRKRANILASAAWDLILNNTQDHTLLEKFPRDMNFLVLYGLELPVIHLTQLTLQSAANYLCILENSEFRDVNSDRRLFGLLHVGPPCNVILLQDNLAPHIENYVLAHELGHFLADFFQVKQLWTKAFPAQYEAVKRFFAWETVEEGLELRAALKGLPPRPNTITARGKSLSPEITNREILADLVAREFLAPWNVVTANFNPNRTKTVTFLHETFGLPLRVAAYYHDELARELLPRPDTVDRLFASLVSPERKKLS